MATAAIRAALPGVRSAAVGAPRCAPSLSRGVDVPHPLIVHCKRAPFDVYIGRGKGSGWGNPFTWKQGTLAEFVVPLDEVLPRYQAWVLSQPELVARIKRELRAKRLGCWCAPKPCHGEILAAIANDEPLPYAG